MKKVGSQFCRAEPPRRRCSSISGGKGLGVIDEHVGKAILYRKEELAGLAAEAIGRNDASQATVALWTCKNVEDRVQVSHENLLY
jgi:hypothetical protein